MAVTLASFRAQFPEMQKAPDDLVSSALALADPQVNPTVYGTRADEALLFYAAHVVACSPFGQNARLASDKNQSTYGEHFKRLQIAAGAGLRYG